MVPVGEGEAVTTPKLIASMRQSIAYWQQAGCTVWACQVAPEVERVVNRLERAERKLRQLEQEPALFQQRPERENKEGD